MGLTFLQYAITTADTNPYTFSSQNLGAAAADRYIICVVTAKTHYSGKVIDSVTIGGVSATIVVQQTKSYYVSAIVIAAVPSGATGDVVVTASGSMDRGGIGLYRVTSLTSATAEDNGGSDVADPTYDIDVTAGGIIVAGGITSNATTVSFVGVTEDYDTQVESGNTLVGGSDTFIAKQTNLTVTLDFASPGDSSGVFASWGIVPKSAGGGVGIGSPWIFMKEALDKGKKYFKDKGLWLPDEVKYAI